MFGESTLRVRWPDKNNNLSDRWDNSGPTPTEKLAIAGRIWLVVSWPRIALRKSQVKFVWDEVFWNRAAGALTAPFVYHGLGLGIGLGLD